MSGVYYQALNQKLAQRLAATLAGNFAAQPQPVGGVAASEQQVAVGGQRYALVNAASVTVGAELTVVNVGRPAAAQYAPADAGYLGGGAAGGGGGNGLLTPHDLAGSYHTGTLSPAQAPWAVLNDGSRTWLGATALIGPTARLMADMSTADTSLVCNVDTFPVNAVLRLDARDLTEFVRITAGPTGDGPYTYTVTRDLAATTAQRWLTGDPLLSTGTAGNSWIEITSGEGVSTLHGPALGAYVRTGNAWDAQSIRWRLGNLRGDYTYAESDVYGFAAGDPFHTWVAADDVNGFRIMHGDAAVFNVDPDGVGTFGFADGGHIEINPANLALDFYNGKTLAASFDAQGRSIYGFERLGNPLGPCVEWGPVKSAIAPDDESLTRFGFWLRSPSERFFFVVSGSEDNPDDALLRIGRDNDAHFLQLRDKKLSWAGENTSLSEDGTFTALNANIAGVVTATSGTIGGWTLASTGLTGGAALLHSSGYAVFGTSNNVVKLSAVDTQWRIAVGNATMGSAPFRVSKTGVMFASSVYIDAGDTHLTPDGLYLNGSYSDSGKVRWLNTNGHAAASIGANGAGASDLEMFFTVNGTLELSADGGLTVGRPGDPVGFFGSAGIPRPAYIASPTAAQLRDVLVKLGLMAAS